MTDFFKDIFEYHHFFNRKLLEQLQENKEKLPARTFPLFCHLVSAHQIWNARITGKKPLGVHQVHSLEECKEINRTNLIQTLEILQQKSLEEIVHYTTSKGDNFNNPVEEILFHVANHTSHHRGQIVSDLRQSGVAPLVTDYIFYKR